MSLLNDLRTNIGDDAFVSGVIVVPGSLLFDLRTNIGDDDAPAPSGGIPVGAGVNVGSNGISTNNAITRWDGTDGTTVQNSLVIIDDSGNITSPGGATLGGPLILGDGLYVSTRTVTAAGDITVGSDDTVIFVNKTVGAPTIVNLPATPRDGCLVIIKDRKGDAALNNISIVPMAGTIDSFTSFLMTQNYQSLTLLFNDSEWTIV